MADASKTSRRSIRFSIRTLLVLPILMGLYFCLGYPTRSRGIDDLIAHQTGNHSSHAPAPEYVAPLVLRCESVFPIPEPGRTVRVRATNEYFFWFFGYVAKLPWGTDEIRDVPYYPFDSQEEHDRVMGIGSS